MKNYTQLTIIQRYQIEAYKKVGKSNKFVAKELGISESTISREIRRNISKSGRYIAKQAQVFAEEKKERFGRNRKFCPEKQKLITKLITEEQWSPEQIVGYCKLKNVPMVSIERIYQFIREDKASGGALYKNLRHKLKHRKRPVGGKKTTIKNKVSIDQRPEVINNKERFGDWEIDTIVGPSNKGAILTLVERTTGFLMMRLLEKGKNAEALAKELIDMGSIYKKSLLSITADNGTEFARHEIIALHLELDFYFAHPYSSWERGLNEYTNKLIRQYIPKDMNFNTLTQEYIVEIQHKINRRPRKNLNFNNPKNQFYKLVA